MMYDKSVKDLGDVRRLGFTVSFRSRTLPFNYSSYILCWTGVVTSMDVLYHLGIRMRLTTGARQSKW